MKASELIAALQKGMELYDDLDVEGYNRAGDLDDLSGVACCNNYRGQPRFVVTPDHDEWAE
jgi:hypothetical protein